MEVTSSGLTPFALVTIVASVVTGVTVLVALVGILIDRDAARHERKGDR